VKYTIAALHGCVPTVSICQGGVNEFDSTSLVIVLAKNGSYVFGFGKVAQCTPDFIAMVKQFKNRMRGDKTGRTGD